MSMSAATSPAWRKDVHATLRDVIADGAGITPEAAEERLAGMKRAGRYLLDVY